jgi:transcriptional regulator with XRE-family HTH domain
MPPSQRRLDHGNRSADEMLRRLGRELRAARTLAGLSQRKLAHEARISPSQEARLERAEVPSASIRVFSVLFAILGLATRMGTFPEGSPARDAGHTRLIRRFVARLPASIRVRTEIVLRAEGDLRAWDAELHDGQRACTVEAETVIADVQALDRRIGLKMRDDHVAVVILLVADTVRNRAVIADAGPLLAARFPLSTRQVMAHLRAGRIPPRSGLVVL